jgi:chromosome segregation ATPase
MSDRRLAFIRELEQADEAVAAVLTELDELYAACEAVRGRALELEAFFVRLPDERAAASLAAKGARAAVDESRAAAERAAEELRAAEMARDDERIAAARRFDIRARDALRTAERRLHDAEEHAGRLEAQADAAVDEARELTHRGRQLADALAERPRLAAEAGAPPEEGLAGIAEWGTGARAALLVARSQLAAERDAVVRQANELGALVLGEPLTATSAAGVARRVERELGTR